MRSCGTNAPHQKRDLVRTALGLAICRFRQRLVENRLPSRFTPDSSAANRSDAQETTSRRHKNVMTEYCPVPGTTSLLRPLPPRGLYQMSLGIRQFFSRAHTSFSMTQCTAL